MKLKELLFLMLLQKQVLMKVLGGRLLPESETRQGGRREERLCLAAQGQGDPIGDKKDA